tara:strand:- start:1915 stop:2559 length:645 start_codon:yes stop_codon:yes gene_type:complete
MKELTVLKDNKWVWPKEDQNSWKYQSEYNKLHDVILPYLKSKKVMVQAGGNCGYLLNSFVDTFEYVYTFEPDPINFYCLNHNVTSQNVIKMQCCVSNDNNPVSTQQLIRPERPNDTGGVHVNGKGYTPTIKIDDLHLPDCSLIQLDVEGYELKAILGAIKTIQLYKPVLCVEFCEKWLNRYNNKGDEIMELIKKLDYKCVETYGVDKIFIPNEL